MLVIPEAVLRQLEMQIIEAARRLVLPDGTKPTPVTMPMSAIRAAAIVAMTVATGSATTDHIPPR